MLDFELTVRERYALMRKRKKITLKQIAEILGCTAQLVSLYENNQSGMSDDKIKAYQEIIEKA